MLIERRAGGLALAAIVIGIAVIMSCASAHAASPLGVGSAEPSFQTTGAFGGWLAWINDHQQSFYRALTGALKAMREDPGALSALIGLSFAYGVFHAAGPGHGKAVISSYMIANEIELKRGVVISFISALLQGAVAIALVGTAYLVLRGTSITLTAATSAMEIASFGLIVAFGFWLLARKIWSLIGPRLPAVEMVTSGPTASLFAAPMQGYSGNTGPRGLGIRIDALDRHHTALEPGSVCQECGKTHLPSPNLVGGDRFSLREAMTAIVAVGLRPCSGALLVMTFSLLNGLYLGGVLSVLAMAVGTAITVSALATLAVSAKALALRFAGPASLTAQRLGSAIEIAGALFIIAIGSMLLGAALT